MKINEFVEHRLIELLLTGNVPRNNKFYCLQSHGDFVEWLFSQMINVVMQSDYIYKLKTSLFSKLSND